MKYSKGLIASLGLLLHQKFSDPIISGGQMGGMVILSILYTLIEPFTKKLSGITQGKIPLLFSGGVALGSSLGTIFSNQILTDLPSSVSSLIGFVLGLLTAALIAVGERLFSSKTNPLKNTKQDPTLKNRFFLGLEVGLVIGSTLGAFTQFIHPGWGIAGSAIGSIIGTVVGVGLSLVAPSLLKKINISKNQKSDENKLENKSKNEPSAQYSQIKKSIKIGSLVGSCIGIVVGTLLLPGIGTVIGGIIFAGAGGAIAGTASWLMSRKNGSPGSQTLFQRLFTQSKNLSNLTFGMKVGMAGFSLIGALVGTFFFPGIGTVAGAAIGGLVGIALGGLASSCILANKKTSTKSEPPSVEENKSKQAPVPFIKKVKLGFSLGSTIGSVAGAVIGSFFPVIGTALGGLAGGFVGGLVGVGISTITEAVCKIKGNQQPLATNTEKDIAISQVKEQGEQGTITSYGNFRKFTALPPSQIEKLRNIQGNRQVIEKRKEQEERLESNQPFFPSPITKAKPEVVQKSTKNSLPTTTTCHGLVESKPRHERHHMGMRTPQVH